MLKTNNNEDRSKYLNLNDRQILLILSIFILLIGLWIPTLRPLFPSKEEHFFEYAILGEDMRGENYYPENDPNINIGEQVKWNIQVYNHMEKNEYIAIKIKILNSTMVPPDSTTCTPSQTTEIFTLQEPLENNETITIPLSWSINRIDDEIGFTTIKSIKINNLDIDVNVRDQNNNFRIISELWILNSKLGDLDFGWESVEGKRCIWTQIWFNTEN